MSSPLAILLLCGVGIVAVACGLWALRLRVLLARLRSCDAASTRRHDEAERATRSTRRFVAGVTHELRTPLTAVIGFSELLHDGRAGPVNRSQREYLGVVRSSAGHLLTLIDEVLDSASVEAGHIRLDPEPVSPAALAATFLTPLEHVAAQRGVELAYRPEDLGTALLDPARLRQVIVNLLSNAIKFTDAGGRVTLSLARRRERLLVSVTDTGIGIDDADRGRIFDAFVRLGGRDRAGSGLGLALTRQIVHAQGGDVGVESEAGVGSTFTAWLPWVEAGTAPAHSEAGWQAVVAAMGIGEPADDAAAPLGRPGALPPRRFRPRGAPRAPDAADGASRSASARAGRP